MKGYQLRLKNRRVAVYDLEKDDESEAVGIVFTKLANRKERDIRRVRITISAEAAKALAALLVFVLDKREHP